MSDILNDLSHRQQVINAIDQNMTPFYMGYGRVEGYIAVENERISYGATDVPIPFLNGVFRAELTSIQIEPTVNETVAFFKEHGQPAFWWVGPTTRPSDLGRYLLKAGARSEGVVPGMAVPLAVLPTSVPTPENFRIELVKDETSLEKWTEALLACYSVPPDVLASALRLEKRRGFDLPISVPRYIGYLDDEPVAVSSLYTGAGVAGIYTVGTLPQARGKGIGAAITLKPLLDAREAGYKVGVLQASDMGHSVYKRLGFVDYCEFELYSI